MKIVIAEPLGVEQDLLLNMAREALGAQAEIMYYDTRITDTAGLIERGKDAEVLVVSNLPLNREVIEGCRKLKLLSVAFTGIDHIDVEACRRQGIMICNCAGYSNCAVADLVFGLLISIYRNIPACDRAVRVGQTKDGLVGFELEGKKFGVVGTGAIGSRVIRIAQAFGCDVYAYSRTPKAIDGVTNVSLDQLLSVCDVVSLHVPLTADTKDLINRDNLKLMKPNAVLINTARGPVVNSGDLAAALSDGTIAAAGIDVFETEPPIPGNHPLLQAPNALVTPHVAFATKEALVKRAAIVFDNIRKWMDGTPVHVM
ncbi:2-hydroxyacid dehydrogenase [Diplocloster agilis]|uniref:2-hydroxyacid dehydrogenase n=1 Tax=Diplocloster agilis TaxID=2850323 RepID=UPI0008206F34|nr:2-hydroxyacid dehydrogenase [Suonthocola fibrivorans]MCU6735130.1 2-hydroxyacid dehydrogenase [Suonthocola fibrivorans]SCJ64882.1 Glycerate dehydrogenase [uncultured Clostridium sp.]